MKKALIISTVIVFVTTNCFSQSADQIRRSHQNRFSKKTSTAITSGSPSKVDSLHNFKYDLKANKSSNIEKPAAQKKISVKKNSASFEEKRVLQKTISGLHSNPGKDASDQLDETFYVSSF